MSVLSDRISGSSWTVDSESYFLARPAAALTTSPFFVFSFDAGTLADLLTCRSSLRSPAATGVCSACTDWWALEAAPAAAATSSLMRLIYSA